MRAWVLRLVFSLGCAIVHAWRRLRGLLNWTTTTLLFPQSETSGVSCGPLELLRSWFEEPMQWNEMAGEIHAKRLNRSGTRRVSSTILTAPRVPTVMLTSHSVALDKRALHRLALPARMSNRQSTGEWKKHSTGSVCKTQAWFLFQILLLRYFCDIFWKNIANWCSFH